MKINSLINLMRLSGNQKKSHIVCLGLSQKSITIFLILKDVKCVISVGYLKNYWLSWPFKQLFRESIFLECGSIDHFVVYPFKNFLPPKSTQESCLLGPTFTFQSVWHLAAGTLRFYPNSNLWRHFLGASLGAVNV